MRTILYTCFNDAYAPLAAITVPRLAEYAERHGMDFTCFRGPFVDDDVYWCKFDKAPELLGEYERIIWMDVDQLVTNFTVTPALPGFGFHVSKDWGEDAVGPFDVSACGIVMHLDCRQLLDGILHLKQDSKGKPFPEQSPMRAVIKQVGDGVPMRPNAEGCTGMINIHQRNPFNSVPEQVCPGKVPDPWIPGDWCAHITMVPVERRVEIAKEILETL